MTLWSKFKFNFANIINDIPEYKKNFDFLVNYNQNVILYSYYGFPFDLFIDEIIKKKFNLTTIYRKELLWNKIIIYNENQYFFEIDLDNPNMPKKYNLISNMLLEIIKTKAINSEKHLIIIKNIDKLKEQFFAFRIILERFFNNCYFICITNQISKIENPIKSRFALFRFPLFTTNQISTIFNNYLQINLNPYLIKNNCRNIIFAIFIAQTEIYEPLLVDENFCSLNYPPFKDFLKSNYNLKDIRQLSYKFCQYNLGIKEITLDLLKLNKKNYNEILKNAVKLEELLTLSNKGREPIYIEALLNQLLI